MENIGSSSTHSYSFKTTQIPRLSYSDPEVDRLISEKKPVIIEDSKLVASALKWNVSYLQQHIGSDRFPVFTSDNHKFKYYDDNKIQNVKEFIPPYIRESMTFPEFAKKLKYWKPGNKRLYLQAPLNNTVGPEIVRDFLAFNWPWVNGYQSKLEWGPLTSNLLLISQPGTITPVHYDEQENFLTQLHGGKKAFLFPPNQFECLYPHPVFHPHDRQSQVDFDAPDHSRFPKFKDAVGCEGVIMPGDVLFIPMYWWHYLEAFKESDYSVSITFWYKSSSKLKIEYPLNDQQKIAMMRNVEKILLEALMSPSEVSNLLKTLVSGRFT